MDLSEIPAIDQHAHNLLRPAAAMHYPYAAAFSEGSDPLIRNHHAQYTLCYRRSLREIATLLNCEPTEAAILERRQSMGLEALTRHCFTASNLASVLLDDGFLPDTILPLDWHQQFVPVQRLLRLERLAEELWVQCDRFDDFVHRFCQTIADRPVGVVGLKSIAAYRSGLAIQPVREQAAAQCFRDLQETVGNWPLRLDDKTLIDFLLYQALAIAAKNQIPIQFHTGFGDPDLDLRWANPLHLRDLLEEPHLREVPIVLLHAAYPFSREAAYLASVYPQVYVDYGLAVPFLSVSGMDQTLRQLLELAPTSKVMFSSDAHFIPELYYLGAKWGRQALGQVLEQALTDGDLSATEADQVAIDILHENAAQLYQLGDWR